MTPEEKFNQQVWEILQRIKEELFATETGKPVKYRIPNIVGVGIIPPDRSIKILYKLQEWKAFEILRNARGVRIGRGDLFYLIINPSIFDELYQKYGNLNNKKDRLTEIKELVGQDDEDNYDEDDCFSYDGGISTPYENTDLELFILKKILLEHKRRDDSGFMAKELSFNQNSLEDICKMMNRLIEDKILYLSANTKPERLGDEEGIEDEDGFINWKMVKKLDRNPQGMDKETGCVIFDTEIADEVKLKGRIDIAVEEFMNDKVYTPLGIMMDKTEVDKILAGIKNEEDKSKKSAVEDALTPKRITYPYYKQREIIIDEISKDNRKELFIPLNNFHDQQVDVLKTLLALEKENLLRITELRSNPVFDEKGNFTGNWSVKDNPVARIYPLKMQLNKQEPMLVKIIGMPELDIKGFKEKVILQKPKNKKIRLKSFPEGTKWENITIQFLNGQEVIVKVKEVTFHTNYEELGFQDERRELPNKQGLSNFSCW